MCDLKVGWPNFEALRCWCSVAGRPPICRETLRTRAPVNHLRLIDLVTRGVGGGQTRGVANGAVDIDRFSADATNQVVVVVTDTIFVKG